MTSAMLATYPDVFAGGAIIAGLPYGCAANVQEALDCMFQGRSRSGSEWGDLVRGASRHKGPWPTVSVWHGTNDTTVKPMNAGESVKQWVDVHGLQSQRPEEDRVDGYPRLLWRGPDGRAVVESYTITGMAHGTPLDTRHPERQAGAAGAFLLDVGISSSYRIAESWSLTGTVVQPGTRETRPNAPDRPAAILEGEILTGPGDPRSRSEPLGDPREPEAAETGAFDVGATITKALRAAGLMKD
jgi:feruloyl esterase